MAIYIALLRGVNVGGNTLKMDRLRELCGELGVKKARTCLQNGNVVSEGQHTALHWQRALEKKLAGESRLPVSVVVRTAVEMARILAGNPFLREKGIDVARLAVTFLQQAPSKAALDALGALEIGSERFHHAGKEICLHCLNGFANAKLYTLDKVLAQKATTRNWNTVIKLCEMCSQ